MTGDPSIPPPTVATSVAPVSTQHSNRATSRPQSTAATTDTTAIPTTTSITTQSSLATAAPRAMATPGFLRQAEGLRSSPHASYYPIQPPMNSFNTLPTTTVNVLIRRLPLHITEEAFRCMVIWSEQLVSVELLPVANSEDEGFQSGIARFRSRDDALAAKRLLDGRSLAGNDGASIIVEILGESPPSTTGIPVDAPTASTSGSASSTSPSSASTSTSANARTRFNNFQARDPISPLTVNGGAHELPHPESSTDYNDLFSNRSPIGNRVAELNRISGKTLIVSDLPDDDETTDLLKDPVAYAENGATAQRRATAPQIPIARMMSGLSLNTNPPPPAGPSSMPQYAGSMSAHVPGPFSPLNNGAAPYMGMSHRHNFPPVNLADQNPPCNTLYVGNLPLDTSEEELKALFSKQRGYKRLCFRSKTNGPMCFVEFEDISFATKALQALYGQTLHNSVKGGIRLSFSKNPLGVRSAPAPGQAGSGMGNMSGMMPGSLNGFTSASGPPPGLTAPPGLGNGHGPYQRATNLSNGHIYQGSGFHMSPPNPGWNGPVYNSMNMPATSNGPSMNGIPPNGPSLGGLPPSNGGSGASGFPPHMMGL